MQEGLGEAETGVDLWAKLTFQHGSRLWAILQEVRQSLGTRKDTWAVNRGRERLESNGNFLISPQRQASKSEGGAGVAATEGKQGEGGAGGLEA